MRKVKASLADAYECPCDNKGCAERENKITEIVESFEADRPRVLCHAVNCFEAC